MSSTPVAPLPKKINIMGITYRVSYMSNASEVDVFKRESLCGQIDYWTRTIRIHTDNRSATDLWHILIHEVLHGLFEAVGLNDLNDDEARVGLLTHSLADTIARNGWMKFE